MVRGARPAGVVWGCGGVRVIDVAALWGWNAGGVFEICFSMFASSPHYAVNWSLYALMLHVATKSTIMDQHSACITVCMSALALIGSQY